MNRKGFWGFTILAGCDAKCKFIMWCNKAAGSQNDISAWKSSTLYDEIIVKRKMNQRYFIIGDEAFICHPQVLIPWGGRGLSRDQDSFNYHLSARRQVIERAFGILVRRWGIFMRPMTCSLKYWSLVTSVAAKLHNVCIDAKLPMARVFAGNTTNIDRDHVELNDEEEIAHDRMPNYEERIIRDPGSRRKEITAALEAQGISRPSRSRLLQHNNLEH
jgi:hypothetical protein